MNQVSGNSTYTYPDSRGYFGKYGGRFVPETLMPALLELEEVYASAVADPVFSNELDRLLHEYGGRPTPLTFALRLTKQYGAGKIYMKREDLCHTGSHKINNTIGQILLAQRSGKKRVVAETGAGQHGVATATVSARMGMPCVIYMGEEDMYRQKLNVRRMEMLGAEVKPVRSGSRTLKEARSEAISDWISHVHETFYVLGSAVGPHPYPMIVRDFQSVIGRETRDQILQLEGRLPDILLACVGGGSNAIGLFHPFLTDNVRMVGVEAGGLGVTGKLHAAALHAGTPGVLHGSLTYVLLDEKGQISPTHSISAGLDYPGVGPEHSALKDIGRVEYVFVTDKEAIEGAALVAQSEGIIPALETAHAFAYLNTLMPHTSAEDIVVVNFSGRGDKDLETLATHVL